MAYKKHASVLAYYKKWRDRNREKLRLKARERYYKNKEKEKERHSIWASKNRVHLRKYTNIRRMKNKAVINERARLWRAKVKAEVFAYYGGYLCSCCGISEPKFLTIDHIVKSGKGKYERKQLYVWLKTKGFPSGFRVLCFNCNLGRDKNGGICPHTEVTKCHTLINPNVMP